MRVLITDDEAPARMRLQGLLQEIDDIQVVGEAANGEQALNQCRELQPDLVLLDIRMPGIDGLQTARYLTRLERPPAVIFTTAYDEHAIEAFSAHAVAYLLKPVRIERLQQALESAKQLTRNQIGALNLDTEQEEARTHLCVHNRGNLQLVPIEQVYFFLAEQKYVTVRHSEGEVLIEESLKSLEQEFGQQFLRIHRNALVAADQLVGMERTPDGRQQAVLQCCPERLEISRRHVPGIRKRLKGLSHH